MIKNVNILSSIYLSVSNWNHMLYHLW